MPPQSVLSRSSTSAFLLRPYRDLMILATLLASDGIASRQMAYLYMCQKKASPHAVRP